MSESFHDWLGRVHIELAKVVHTEAVIADWQGMHNCNYTPTLAVYQATGVDVAWMDALDTQPMPYSLEVYELKAFGRLISH